MLTGPDSIGVPFLDYIVVFEDDAPPKQCEISAISDQHAVDLVKKEYPGFEWKLYRSGNRGAIHAHAPEPVEH
jgi:hypothetical protein